MSTGRFAYLDSIRGIAALLVVAEHTALTLASQYIELKNSFFIQMFGNMELGRFGVMLFFLTSGFVIPWSLNSKYHAPLKRFAITRFFRLYPLYWFAMALALAFGSYGYYYESGLQVFANISMLQKFMGHENLIAVFWTLQVEMIFYVVCAGLFYFSILRHRTVNLSITLGWLLISLGIGWLRYNFNIRLPMAVSMALFAMFYGCLLRQCFIDKSSEARKDVKRISLLFVVIFPVACYLNYQNVWLKFLIANMLAFVVFVLFITRFKIENKTMAYLGTISYSLYLMHPIVLNAYISLLESDTLKLIPVSWSVFLVCAMSILFSQLTYRLIEAPFVNLGRSIQSRVSPLKMTAA